MNRPVVGHSLGRRLVNLLPVARRSKALTNGVVDETMGRWSWVRISRPPWKRIFKKSVFPHVKNLMNHSPSALLYMCNLLLWLTWWWMMLYRTLRKVTSTNMRKNMYVVTPRCAAAAVVSAVVPPRPTKEYTHPYSMMHRRLPTAGIEIAPHYHQMLVVVSLRIFENIFVSTTTVD